MDSEWLEIQAQQLWTLKHITYKDLPEYDPDLKYDPIKECYWVRRNSKLAVNLALKGIEFGHRKNYWV